MTIKQAKIDGMPVRTKTPKSAAQTPAVAAAERSISPSRSTIVIPTAKVAMTADCINKL